MEWVSQLRTEDIEAKRERAAVALPSATATLHGLRDDGGAKTRRDGVARSVLEAHQGTHAALVALDGNGTEDRVGRQRQRAKICHGALHGCREAFDQLDAGGRRHVQRRALLEL